MVNFPLISLSQAFALPPCISDTTPCIYTTLKVYVIHPNIKKELPALELQQKVWKKGLEI